MDEKKKELGQKATVLVAEEGKPKKKFPVRLILIYFLLLASGLFVGILFAYAFRG
jgi:hypothetical protein